MNRIAIFGGTFNPIHKGHINLCLECNRKFNFDKIILIPTNIPPHKDVIDLASNEQRLDMCKLAIKDNPLFEVSDIEMRLKGISYTINTINELKKIYKHTQIYLIIGSDMLFVFDKWKDYKEILDKVVLVIGARHSNQYNEMIKYVKVNLKSHSNIRVIRVKTVDVSSTQIRYELSKNRTPALLERQVYEYIVKNNIYIF